MKLSSLCQKTARRIGTENVCLDTVRKLGIHLFLLSHGFNGKQADTAIMQAIYPGSELRTVRCLQENSALCELLGIHPEDITKDTLYRSVRKLWDIQASWMADCLVLAIVVMDAGFSSEENLEWLRTNGYDYITVMRSRGVDYTCESDVIEKSTPESGSSGLLDCLNHRKSLPKNRVVELEGVRRCESHSVG